MTSNDFDALLRQKADQAGAPELSPDSMHSYKDHEVVSAIKI